MKKPETPQCPYCGKKLGFATAFSLRREGEYCCKACGGVSNITLVRRIYPFAGICVAIAAVFVVLGAFVLQTVNWLILLGTILPFVVFYIGTPFFLELKRPILHRRKVAHQTESLPNLEKTAQAMQIPAAPDVGAAEDNEPTRVMNRPAPQESVPAAPADSVAALEEALAREAEPVFYERPQMVEKDGEYVGYRRPLSRRFLEVPK